VVLIQPVKTKKTPVRDPSKKNFSIAIPKTLVAKVQKLADLEHRNRNSQIEHLLTIMVSQYEAENGPIIKESAPTLREIEGSAPPPPKWQSPDIHAGASTHTKKRITPDTNEKSA
jgi:hypothetical protein